MARKRYKPEEIVAAAAGRRRSAAKTSMLNVADQLAKGVGILKVARSLGIQSRRNSNVRCCSGVVWGAVSDPSSTTDQLNVSNNRRVRFRIGAAAMGRHRRHHYRSL